MSVRSNTLKKYIQAVIDLENTLRANNGVVDAYEFTHSRAISAGTLGDLVKSDFLVKIGKSRYRRTGKTITADSIKVMLEKRDIDRGRMPQPDPKTPAANDPVQSKIDFGPDRGETQKLPTQMGGVSEKDYKALERRVASLEQLLIRRSIA